MKIAIVQDELVRKGGAEQVTLSMHKAFPKAPIYTLSYNPDNTYKEFRGCTIKTSWFGRLIKDDTNLKRFFFPFGILAMQQLDLSEYDVILQSTTHCAKYVRVKPEALVITYCHTPFRLVWRPETYEVIGKANSFRKKIYELVIDILKKIDQSAAGRTDWFLTNSKEVVPRIQHAYQPQNEITVINPSIKCANFFVSDTIEDYFLVVSRFEPYKKIDLVISAFNKMKGKKLIVVGTGSMEKELKELAEPNIQFLKDLETSELTRLYSKCKAFIFPQLEDYGLTPLEANASGRPVIAYGKGGVLDTMIPYKGDEFSATAVFFEKQTISSIINAVNLFETLDFNPAFIRKHAEKFDERFFVQKLQNFIYEKNEVHETVKGQLKFNNY